MDTLSYSENYTGLFEDVKEEDLNKSFADSFVKAVKLICMNMFTWEGLPPEIEPWMLENWLFNLGWVGFGYDKEYGYICLWANPQEIMDIDYRPTRMTLTGNGNVFNKLVYYGTDTEKTLLDKEGKIYNKDTACVLIKNNDTYTSTFDLVYPYLYTYYLTKRKEITMLDQLQLQSLIMASNEDRATIEQLKRDIKRNKPIIALNIKGMKYEPKPLTLAFNNNLLDLHSFAKAIYGEIMEHIGIESINYEKAERMITSEVDKNKEQTQAGVFPLLRTRQQACERINELFGLNISVRLNEDIKADDERVPVNISARSVSHGYFDDHQEEDK